MRTIGVEEHFIIPELLGNSASYQSGAGAGTWKDALRRITDFLDLRIPEMDRYSLDMQVLSLTTPGIQAEEDTKRAVSHARKVNDFLKTVIEAHPTRFGGFAALPLQDPRTAAHELERTVRQYGFSGALINGPTRGKYLDHPDFEIVWERAAALDVPLYLHPAAGPDVPHVFRGHEELVGPMWSWGVQNGTQAMRIIFGKVFDRHPSAKLLLGHMGEGLPYALWQMDSRWAWHNHRGIELDLGNPSEYVRRNIYITTSGVASVPPLLCALQAIGADHILFATDYPFEEISVATEFVRTAPISEADRAKIAHENAEKLLHLRLAV
jgi:2,3-dihydroxybenzoate decarboxylase